MDLSVVVPTFGGLHRLPETLGALAAATPPEHGFEVVIGDDGSPEPIPDGVGGSGRLVVRVVRWTPNRGRASACNRAIAAATGRVVLMLDDDMTIAPGALTGHVEAHRHGEPVAVVGRIDPSPRHFAGPFGRFLAEEEARRRGRLVAAGRHLPFSDCLTGHFSLPRAAFQAAGGYDESFTAYGFEDVELAFRLQERGVCLVFRDDLAAVHRSASTGFLGHCRRHLEAGAMAVAFSARHPDPRVRAFLRVDGMPVAEQASAFRRLMSVTHGAVRRTPAPLRGLLPRVGLGLALTLGLTGPRRLRHVAYHVVRDMFYAQGVADARDRARVR